MEKPIAIRIQTNLDSSSIISISHLLVIHADSFQYCLTIGQHIT